VQRLVVLLSSSLAPGTSSSLRLATWLTESKRWAAT
jgi:hypothetical protein